MYHNVRLINPYWTSDKKQ